MSTKISPFLQQVVYLVVDFLKSIQYEKQAKKLQTDFDIPQWIQKDNPLLKKGLKKVLKEFINSNDKIFKYYQNRKPQSQDQSQNQNLNKNKKALSPKQSPINKPKSPKVNSKQSKPNSWMVSQFAQPKRLQDLNDDVEPQQIQKVVVQTKSKKLSKKSKKVETSSEESSSEQQQTPKPKKQQKAIKKQKKVKGPVDSSYLNSEQQFELQGKQTKKVKITDQKKPEPVKVVKSQIQTRKQSVEIEQVQSLVNNKNVVNNSNNNNGPKKFFSRIDAQNVGFIPQNRRDNTFEAKARYGAGDSWGQFGYEKLRQTRGDSFKKTKGKLKNKAFQGSGINIHQVNSVPIA